MTNWLVKLNDNWADEMDVQGFSIMSSADFVQWARTVERVAREIDAGHSFEFFIGTNEWIDWDSGRQFKDAFSCDVIEDFEAEALKRLLIGESRVYGVFPTIEEMTYFLEDKG